MKNLSIRSEARQRLADLMGECALPFTDFVGRTSIWDHEGTEWCLDMGIWSCKPVDSDRWVKVDRTRTID